MPNENTYIQQTATAGNGLFASHNIEPGSQVLTITRPLIAVPETPHLEDTCSNCFVWAPGSIAGGARDVDSVKPCTGCKVARYCGKACQTQGWESTHKYECKYFSQIYKSNPSQLPPNQIRAIVQLLRRIAEKNLNEDQKDALKTTQSHVDDFKNDGTVEGKERWSQICMMAEATENFCEVKSRGFPTVDLYCRFLINSMTLVTPSYDPVGICFDPLISLLNHSCAPNAVISFDGPCLNVRSLHPIAKGSEITISYIDTSYPFPRRQLELSDRYFFTCACPVCTQGPTTWRDTFLSQPANQEEMQDIEDRAFTLLGESKGTENEIALQKLKDAISSMQNTKIWPPHRQPLPEIRQHYAIEHMIARDWPLALAHNLYNHFHADPYLFPEPSHPLRTVHGSSLSMLILQITHLVRNDASSVRVLEKYNMDWASVLWKFMKDVDDNVGKSYGDEGSFAKRFRKKFREVEGDMRKRGFSLPPDEQGLEEQWRRLRTLADELAG